MKTGIWWEAPQKNNGKIIQTPTLKLSSTMFSVIAAILFGSLTMFNTVAILVLLKAKSKISEKECGLVYFEILMAFVTMVFAATQVIYLYFGEIAT